MPPQYFQRFVCSQIHQNEYFKYLIVLHPSYLQICFRTRTKRSVTQCCMPAHCSHHLSIEATHPYIICKFKFNTRYNVTAHCMLQSQTHRSTKPHQRIKGSVSMRDDKHGPRSPLWLTWASSSSAGSLHPSGNDLCWPSALTMSTDRWIGFPCIQSLQMSSGRGVCTSEKEFNYFCIHLNCEIFRIFHIMRSHKKSLVRSAYDQLLITLEQCRDEC
jgi:hypothetical protein